MNPFITFNDTLNLYVSQQSIKLLKFFWTKPDRFYHNEIHLRDIIEDIGETPEFRRLNVYEKQALLLAAFFHDAIYDPKKTDNEDQSIQFFLDSYIGKDLKMKKVVCDLIETTKHRKRPTLTLERIFWEADNSKFKKGYEGLLKNEKLIRKENSYASDKVYKEKRIEFLNKCIGLFGTSADKNIKKLIEYVEKKY